MLDLDRIGQEFQAPAAAPLHVRLRNALQAQILDGTLRPGEALPPERTMQDQLGISRSTVRQAFKSLVDAGLLKSVVGSGTFVLDQRRATTKRDLIGIVVPDSNFYIYYANLASALSFRLREAGYRVDMSIHDERSETLAEIVASLLSQQAAAVILVAPNQPHVDDVIRELRANGVVAMMLTRYLADYTDVDYVGADNERIGYDATRYLQQMGHTGIVYIGEASSSSANDRASGYKRAMQDAHLTPQIILPFERRRVQPPSLQSYTIDVEEGQLWARVAQREITAAFCFNDAIASWVQKEIRNFNLVVPRDLSLIGVDNMPYADFFDAPLTTFALPGEEIGNQAAGLLLRRLGGEAFPPQRIRLPARFIQRLSVAAPRLAPVGMP